MNEGTVHQLNKLLHVQLVQKYSISEAQAHHLVRTYGTNAFAVCELSRPLTTAKQGVTHKFGKTLVEGFPFMEEEIEYSCKHEMACTVTFGSTFSSTSDGVNTSAMSFSRTLTPASSSAPRCLA